MPDQSLNSPPPDDEGASQPPRRDDDGTSPGRPLFSGKLPKNPFNDFVNDHLDLTDLEGSADSSRARPSGNPFQLTGRPPFSTSSHDVWNVDDDDDEDDMFDFDDDDDDLTRPPSFGSVFGAGPSLPSSGKKKNDPPPSLPPSGPFGKPPVPGKPSPFGSAPGSGSRPGAPPPPRPGTPPRFMGVLLPRVAVPAEHDPRWKQVSFQLKSDLQLFPASAIFGGVPGITLIPDAERLLKRRFFVIDPIEPGWIAVKVRLNHRSLIGFVRTDSVVLKPLTFTPTLSDLLLRQFTITLNVSDVLIWVSVALAMLLIIMAALPDVPAGLPELQAQVQLQGEQLRQLEAQLNQLRP